MNLRNIYDIEEVLTNLNKSDSHLMGGNQWERHLEGPIGLSVYH